FAYLTHSSTQPCAAPTDSAAIAIRPSSRMRRKLAYPRPRSPSRFSCGTRTSSKLSGWVSEAFQPTLLYAGSAVKPAVGTGTRIDEISFLPSFSPVTAVTVTSLVMSVPELVMNCLLPLITQVDPSDFAVVLVAPASLPPPASVNPNAPSALPEASSG